MENILNEVTTAFKPFVTEKNNMVIFHITKKLEKNFKYIVHLFQDLALVEHLVDPGIYDFNEKDYYQVKEIHIAWHTTREDADMEITFEDGRKVKCVLTSVQLQAITMQHITCPKCGAKLGPEDFSDPKPIPGVGSTPEYRCPKCGAWLEDFTEIEYFKGNFFSTQKKM